MNAIKNGEWTILSVLVNSETVMNYQGFVHLEIRDDLLTIQPIGLEFRVLRATEGRAVLESRGQTYYADFNFREGKLEMAMTRPNYSESVVITAEFQRAPILA